jgi:quercetin dioxygenase-like cupin family protein
MKHVDATTRALEPADPDTFVLPATLQRLLGRADGEAVRLYRVSFQEGARTFWHTHDDIQVLYGLTGRCVVANRQGVVTVLEAGDVVVVAPDEEHWHGAAPGGPGEHLAINLGVHTEWLDSSTDEGAQDTPEGGRA